MKHRWFSTYTTSILLSLSWIIDIHILGRISSTRVHRSPFPPPIDSVTGLEEAVVAEDLAAHAVHAQTEGASQQDGVRGHQPAAAWVDVPDAGVLAVSSLVIPLVVRDLVGAVEETHGDV